MRRWSAFLLCRMSSHGVLFDGAQVECFLLAVTHCGQFISFKRYGLNFQRCSQCIVYGRRRAIDNFDSISVRKAHHPRVGRIEMVSRNSHEKKCNKKEKKQTNTAMPVIRNQ